MRTGQRSSAFVVAAMLAVAPWVAAAQEVPQGMLLSASMSSEHQQAFRAGLERIKGVALVADIGRARIYFVATRDESGAPVDTAHSGYQYMLDAMVFDPASFAMLTGGADGDLLAGLRAGDAVLSETSAEIRRLGVGGQIEFIDGTTVTVRGIVPDSTIQNREIALADPGLARGDGTVRRTFLIRYFGPEDTIEERMEALLPEDARLRLRSLTPSDFVRSTAAILPQAMIKHYLGEFAYKPTEGRTFRRDAAWETANMVITDVPLLGQVRCHRVLIPALTGAMNEVIDRGIGHLIDPSAFQGCDNPRLISVGRGFSRHAWGAAVDINYGDDPVLRSNAQDPRLVAIMDRWRFTSGHLFHNSDPGHFEFVGPPKL